MLFLSKLSLLNPSDGWADTIHDCFEGALWAHRPVTNITAFPPVYGRTAYAHAMAKAGCCVMTVVGRGIMGFVGTATMPFASAGVVELDGPNRSTLSSSSGLQRGRRI